jgi:hypothetical protein
LFQLHHISVFIHRIGLLAFACLLMLASRAQQPRNFRTDGQGRPMGPGQMAGGDSLKQRNSNEDSITIFYRFFDSSRIRFIDSTVGEFTNRYPIPAHHVFLGSLGNPTRSLLFNPNLRPGFDAGFHALDAFRFGIADTRIFQTTRPYTELDYLLGSRSEQTIKILHTQNFSPTWNGSFEYRFLSSPGNFKNNNAAHSSLRIASGFGSKNRRYSGNFIFINNRNRTATNGGIRSDTFLTTTNTAFNSRFNIPTWLGGDGDFGTNFFATSVKTGLEYKNQQIYLRQQYDLGQKDSVLNEEDSSYTRLFYPRMRLQHSFLYQTQQFGFKDLSLIDTSLTNAYANVYRQRFGVKKLDSLLRRSDRWNEITNEMALLLYPQKTNQEQFLKMGVGFQLLQATFDSATRQNFSNLYLMGEYRNRTKNKKWDINAFGRLYLSGLNAGDYTLSVSLQTQLGKKAGVLQLGFQNTNRTPGFVFDQRSDFINQTINGSLKQENWTRLSGNYYLPALGLHLLGNYYAVTNFTYWNTFTTYDQLAALTSVLHLGAEKKFKLSKRWNWYTEVHVQTETTDAINLPPVYTRNRIAYEGSFFKNLVMSTGFEVRYFLPFKADDFSPFNGQWVVQDTTTIANRPDIAAYLHFRIRSFRFFTRLENLNTLDLSRGFSFLNNNLAGPLHPTPGLFFRFGFYWSFVN